MKQAAVFVIAAIALFLIGRFTAPVTVVEDKRKIDSLIRDSQESAKREAAYKEKINHLTILGDTWFNEAQKKPEEKIITRTIYRNDTSVNNHLDSAGIAAKFRARYPVN